MGLKGKKVAILATDGVEQVEFTGPRDALLAAGAHRPRAVDLRAARSRPSITSTRATRSRSISRSPTRGSTTTTRSCFPAGSRTPMRCALDDHAVSFVRGFFDQRKPVAAICHAPWTLIEADVVRGRTLTSWPSLQTDLRNAGAEWVDEEVVVDQGLVTSRKPDDLPAFCAKVVEEIAEGVHAGQHV